MVVRLLYFAWLRERLGCAEEEVTLPAGVDTVGALLGWLSARGEPYRQVLTETARIRSAVNQDFASDSSPIRAGDEIAFFPPITGG
ncbi:molybdopterin converting factor subunit 1 [Acidisoma cellulosilytica]|uniref:Molybdopterin synthase sulfur carrier subunit n=1 Tax=Acidisoma cellulosilyticum TaxID=2802395 RepID=A0A964E2E4_9PROT|nr:molybdopterin converting factor subunit 1 [Acidisoma cellulosilyticum]MCB8879152.1 molybdopterin converting factor subunit 1 [Acidisoma cellulosilyticum]